MRILIDAANCIGCSLCSQLCPQVFGLNERAKAFVYFFPVPEDLRDPVVEAAEQCPAVAISLEP